ncbi:putative auxin efflux carrier component 3-like [Capsicum annuum]|nr:putative auxin efflux carrier component 3-like [Capsicum annuum]
MPGDIEEPFRLSFQIRGNLDLSHSVDLRMKLYVGRGDLLSHIIGILKRLRNTPSQVRTASQSRDTKLRMLSQVNVASVKGTISNQAYKDMPRKPNRRHNDVSLTQKRENPRLDAPGTLLHPTTRMPKPEFFMKLEEKVHAKEEEMHQLQARTQELASKTKSSKSQSRPSTVGARATSATENIVHCSRVEVYNRCFTNERLNVADSPQVLEVTVHPSAELLDSSVPSSAPISKTSKQTQSN